MLQIKTFSLNESDKANEWLDKNHHLVVMSEKSGPEIKVFGTTTPLISIMYDKHGVGSPQYKAEALRVELNNLEQQLYEYKRQLLDHIAARNVFPHYDPDTKGKHQPKETEGWKSHNTGVITTRNMIKLQIAKIEVVKKLLANPDSVNEPECEVA